jgi:hypothetical protein
VTPARSAISWIALLLVWGGATYGWYLSGKEHARNDVYVNCLERQQADVGAGRKISCVVTNSGGA